MLLFNTHCVLDSPYSTKDPDAKDLKHGRKGQDHHAQGQVGPGQGDDKQVGGPSHLARHPDGRNDHDVAKNDDQTDDAQGHQRPDDPWVFQVDAVGGRRAVADVAEAEGERGQEQDETRSKDQH